MAEARSRTMWLVAANNVALRGDIARRCYRIWLNAKVDQAWRRTGFRHDPSFRGSPSGGPTSFALLTLVRAWFSAGCLAGRSAPGEFE